jgi:tetratricopeptide (TPR) repeat protein
MTSGTRSIAAVALGLAVLLAGLPAFAAVTVYSDGARDCYRAAKYDDPMGSGIADCTDALFGMTLSDRDLAGTLVNRGVVYLVHGLYRQARADFDHAIVVNPRLGDAYVNRGAALIGERRFAEGVADIDRGLPMGPDEPEKAYYNRGLADEYLDNIKAAYFDYLKASELKPDWSQPKHELARFTVTRE